MNYEKSYKCSFSTLLHSPVVRPKCDNSSLTHVWIPLIFKFVLLYKVVNCARGV